MLLIIWQKHNNTLNPKYLQERYFYAINEQERQEEYNKRVEEAKKIYDQKRFIKKRLYPSMDSIS